jgi:hypothetical protein
LFSFICDEIYATRLKPVRIKSGPGELFIGTNALKPLFMLMNAAPAELLQLLTIAALQPSPPVLRPATLVLHVTLFTSQHSARTKRKSRHA